MLFARFLKPLMKQGTLVIIDHTGRRHDIGTGGDPKVTVTFHDPKLGTKLFINPALYAGEGYMDGTLTIEDGDLFDMLDLVMANIGTAHGHWAARMLKFVGRFSGLLRSYNTIGRAAKNVAHHYDLSSTLYEHFLDDDMQYSMAYYRSPNDSLEIAQRNKVDHIAAKLCLEPGMKVLDIGCGWGGLALGLHKRHGVSVTGISLSEEQLKIARERADKEDVGEDVRFLFQDYRKVEGTFDRIVSVGMFEHVGPPLYRTFFKTMRDHLAADGVALLHTIGRADGPGASDSWTSKYIFPGGYAPALSEIVPHVEKVGFYITDVEILRMHYAYTLKEWRRRFMDHRDEMERIYDARFCRMWEFFLVSAEASFRHSFNVNFHIQMSPSLDALPLTRDYMYAAA